MSSSSAYGTAVSVPVTILEYPDMSESSSPCAVERESAGGAGNGSGLPRAEVELTEAELAERLRRERAEAFREAEQRLRQEYEEKLVAARAPLAEAIQSFQEERDSYFSRVESEVVQLALAIAAKILHREAQVDPMLVATLVRMAIEKMKDGSSVIVRVSPAKAEKWEDYFAEHSNSSHVRVTADPKLRDQECVVDTELGSAKFGLESQLKEVEQGFFDLLALRPTKQ